MELASQQAESKRFGVRLMNGVPTIFHYSRPLLPVAHFAISMTPKTVEDFDRAGIRFFTFHLNSGSKRLPYPPRTGCYPPQTGDLDEIAGYILKRSPQSYLMPRVLLWGPRDQEAWINEHREESYLSHPSLGSTAWRAEAERHLRELLRHVEASAYCDRVVGYHVGWGTCGEWMYWGWDRPEAVDRSEAILRQFRKWLRRRYRGQAAELQKAWGDLNANFQNAGAPTDEDLRRADLGMFIDPERSHIVPDYYEFLSDLNAELVQYFGKVVKEETQQQALYGIFYGYDIHSNFNDYRLRASAHCGLRRVLEMPEVDFICSPNGYYDRNIGGMDCPQGVTTSVQQRGKVYFNEIDTWTYLSKPDRQMIQSHTWVATPQATREVLRRNFCQALVEGYAMWWMTNQPNGFWYSAPQILDDLRHMAEIYCFGLNTNRQSIAEVALVLDDRSPFYLKLESNQNVMNPCVFSQFFELRRMGTPYNTYLLDDVVAGSVPRHKLYVFLNGFAVSESARDALQEVFRRDHASVAWVYAPGLISNRIDLDNIEKLIGICVRADQGPGPLDLQICNDQHMATRALGKGFDFRSNLRVINSWQAPQPSHVVSSPLFFADDPDAITLGLLTANNKPGYAVKQVDGWQSFYQGAAPAPAAVWREMARYSGIQILDEETDVLYADRSWLALHTDGQGTRHITLPFRADGVFEVFSKQVIAGATQQFSFEAQHWKTYLFYLGPSSIVPPILR